MKSSLTLIALGVALAFSNVAKAAELNVLGFQAWKSSRVDEAKSTLERTQLEYQLDKAPQVDRGPGEKAAILKSNQMKVDLAKSPAGRAEVASRLQKNGRADQRLQQAQLNVQIAQELTVNDYFVLYLSQFKETEAFLEAAKKLSPEETADLMVSYQKHLAGANRSDVTDVMTPGLLKNAGLLSKESAPAPGL